MFGKLAHNSMQDLAKSPPSEWLPGVCAPIFPHTSNNAFRGCARHSQMHARTHMHAHARTRTRTHTHTHTHIYAHMQTRVTGIHASTNLRSKQYTHARNGFAGLDHSLELELLDSLRWGVIACLGRY
jgi:hypothetical protein